MLVKSPVKADDGGKAKPNWHIKLGANVETIPERKPRILEQYRSADDVYQKLRPGLKTVVAPPGK